MTGRLDEPGREGARVVGHVTADDATRVHDDRLASADRPIGGAAVRTSRIRAGGDDRLEGNRVSALVVEELLDRPGDVALGSTDEGLRDQALEHPIRDLAGSPDRRELVVVLDCAQLLDEPTAGNRLDRAAAKRLVSGVGDEVGLEADRAGQPVGEILQERAFRLLELDTLDRPRCLRVAKVGEESRALALDEERGVRALEPDEIVDVRGVRDEQRLFQRLA